MKKIVIIGAGAMGCLYASYLAENSGNEVLLADHNPERIDAIRERGGISVEEKDKGGKFIPLRCLPCGAPELSNADFIFIFVKNFMTETALRENLNAAGSSTIAVTLQNGMGNDAETARFIPFDRIVCGTSNHNSTSLGFGRVLHGACGATVIGSPSGNTAAAAAVSALFDGTGLEVSTAKDIRRAIWRKLLVNMAINPLTMLRMKGNGFIVSDSDTWKDAEALVDEGLAVAEADGVHFEKKDVMDVIRGICSATGEGRSSMLQDRLAGRMTEIDHINGSVRKLAEKYGVPVPFNSLIINEVHAAEKCFVKRP